MLVLCNLQLAILVCSFCDNFCKLFVVSIANQIKHTVPSPQLYHCVFITTVILHKISVLASPSFPACACFLSAAFVSTKIMLVLNCDYLTWKHDHFINSTIILTAFCFFMTSTHNVFTHSGTLLPLYSSVHPLRLQRLCYAVCILLSGGFLGSVKDVVSTLPTPLLLLQNFLDFYACNFYLVSL